MSEPKGIRRSRRTTAIWTGSGVIAVAAIALAITFAVTHKSGNSQPPGVPTGNAVPQSNVLLSDQCGTTNDEGLYEPTTIDLTCGDGEEQTSDMTWSQWGSSNAVGHGTINEDSCIPDCANGKDVAYKVAVALSEPVKAADGKEYFTRVAVSFIGKSPDGSSSQLYKDCSDKPNAPYVPKCPADEQGAT